MQFNIAQCRFSLQHKMIAEMDIMISCLYNHINIDKCSWTMWHYEMDAEQSNSWWFAVMNLTSSIHSKSKTWVNKHWLVISLGISFTLLPQTQPKWQWNDFDLLKVIYVESYLFLAIDRDANIFQWWLQYTFVVQSNMCEYYTAFLWPCLWRDWGGVLCRFLAEMSIIANSLHWCKLKIF